MKQVFEEYADAFLQIIVLALITFTLSAVAFAGVRGILNVSGKIAEVDENISTDYNDLTEMEAFSKQSPPTIICSGSAKLNQSTRYSNIFNVVGGELIIKEVIKENGWTIEKILLTHGHFDHTGAVDGIRESLNIPVFAHRRSDEYLLDARKNLSALCGPAIIVKGTRYLEDGDIISIDENPGFLLQVIYTPGHTTDSVVFYSEKDHVAFVGDTIFKGSIGNDQYPGGNRQEMIESITGKIFALPDDTVLYSGHSDATTVGMERNRYL